MKVVMSIVMFEADVIIHVCSLGKIGKQFINLQDFTFMMWKYRPEDVCSAEKERGFIRSVATKLWISLKFNSPISNTLEQYSWINLHDCRFNSSSIHRTCGLMLPQKII